MTELLTTNIYLQILMAFGFGLICYAVNAYCFKPGKSLLLSSLLLPPVVCVALMAVNGSIGASIAVLDVFGLVRFRSLPGTGQDLICVLYAMVMGLLAAGGVAFSIMISGCLLSAIVTGSALWLNHRPEEMEIHIVVPEDDPAENEYMRILHTFGKQVHLERIKTAGMGTLYELTYRFVLKPKASRTELLDEVRSRNGNLAVTLLEKAGLESF